MNRPASGTPAPAGAESVAAPIIVRIAGLALAAMERFRSERLAAVIARDAGLRVALAGARSDLVDRLFAAVKGSPRDLRRFLLQVKRDCFNGRSLSRHRGSRWWPRLVDLTGPLAPRVVGLEEKLAGNVEDWEATYRGELDGQRRALAQEIASPAFRRGLALASPTVSGNLHHLAASPSEADPRRRRRLESTVLRYLSRTALKLSPYSTFTRVGLASIAGGEDVAPLELVGSRWRERSLVRVKRYLLDQYAAALALYPPFRRSLVTVLNESIFEAAGRYVFLRPSHWELNRTSGELIYHRSALVRVTLEGALVEGLLAELSGPDEWTYGRLAAWVEDRDLAAASDLDRLIEIGFLQLLMPWSTDAGYLEKTMLEHLPTLPREAESATFRDHLAELCALEEGYARSAAPERSVERIRRAVGDAWRAAGKLVGFASDEPIGQPSEFNYYEDVFLEPVRTGKRCELLRLRRSEAEACVRSVRPILGLSVLFDHRHEFVHTLAAFSRESWPDVERIGVLELFAAIQPLWRRYAEFRLAAAGAPAGWRAVFNPLGLPELEELERVRDRVWNGVSSCLEPEVGQVRVSVAELEKLLGCVPGRYRPQTGPCLFLQPADSRGGLWVLNRLKEGTGRFASRYTPIMPPGDRRRYVEELARRSWIEVDGERAELVDVLCLQGDTANLHAPQTHRVLEMPGERSALPSARRLGLGDLSVRIEPQDPWARVYDAAGTRLLPVHLGLGHEAYMPPLVRFLCLFGPSELSAVFPPTPSVREEGWEHRERLVIGTVVLLREAWAVSTERLRADLGSLSGVEAFLAINRWRVAHGLPERVFLIENVSEGEVGDHHRPQYLDFTSPLCVNLLGLVIGKAPGWLAFEEMLPTERMFPRDQDGVGWAVEILLDSLALDC